MRFHPVERRTEVVWTAGTPNPAITRTPHWSVWGVRGESVELGGRGEGGRSLPEHPLSFLHHRGEPNKPTSSFIDAHNLR
jgi:hypothetical protein